MENKSLRGDEISNFFDDPARVTKVLQAGVQKALLVHKKLGHSICEWKDNKVVWIPPEKIIIETKKG
jgi:hypothetical protein